jgi:hypothetical protein
MASRRITIHSRHDLTERSLLFDEHFEERVRTAFEIPADLKIHFYSGSRKV